MRTLIPNGRFWTIWDGTLVAMLSHLVTTAASLLCTAALLLQPTGECWAQGTPADDTQDEVEAEGQTLAELFPTVAEGSQFAATATGAEVEAYMRRLASFWPQAELTTLGRTTEGRPLWALVVAPTEVRTIKPITVLLLGGIHSGECDGKEALLALARDMASGKQGAWWQSLQLIFVPNFNADGNERRGLSHRPGQSGPEQGMGIRENAQGLDLNRDFVKLESPEVRSLVAAMNEYDVDVLVDTHTTNGSLHQYQLTYDIPHNPVAPRAVESWLRSKLIPTVQERLTDAGFSTFYYGNFDQEHRRWSTYGHEPRYSTEYMGLRGKIGILSESYSYVSYQTRFEVSYAFVKEILQAVAEDEFAIRQMLDDAATADRAGGELPIRGALAKTADGAIAKGFQQADGSPPQGQYGAAALEKHTKKNYVVQLWNRAEATASVTMPNYYVIPAQYAWAAGRLVRHGVQMKKLQADVVAEVEVYRIESSEQRPEFQRHRMRRIETRSETQQRTLQAGSYVVETFQPLGVLASYLLEPASDDSLATWNFLDPDVAAGQWYPVLRVNQELSAESVVAINGVQATEQLTLERLMKPGKTTDYGGGPARGARWLKGSSEYVVTSGRRTFAVDAATGSMRRLSELDSLRGKLESLEAFSAKQAESAASIGAFSEDWTHALVSHAGDLYFFDAETEAVRQLTHSPEKPERMAELNPSGTHVAFVRDNNLWVVDCESTELRQITSDGSPELLNGILDWVYQEELYGRGNFKGFWWSPDGRQIAFLQLDQTPVPKYQVSDSISYGQTLETTRYPKAGEPLPQVQVWIADLAANRMQKVDLSDFDPSDRLVGRVSWAPKGELWLQVFNRVQNRQDLVAGSTLQWLDGHAVDRTEPWLD